MFALSPDLLNLITPESDYYLSFDDNCIIVSARRGNPTIVFHVLRNHSNSAIFNTVLEVFPIPAHDKLSSLPAATKNIQITNGRENYIQHNIPALSYCLTMTN